jgi:heme exporter protein A
MSNYSVRADALLKTFGRRLIFNNLSFEFKKNGIFGIAGANGSGKSTLIKIIAGLISPTRGSIIHTNEGKVIDSEHLHNYIGFVSPYLILYDEFTAWENLSYFAKIRGVKFDEERIKFLFYRFSLQTRKDDYVKAYSSGMKQRLKFIFALMHKPVLLIFDEPTSNLDDEGKAVVYEMIKEEGGKNIVIVASNEKTDISLCPEIIVLENYKE